MADELSRAWYQRRKEQNERWVKENHDRLFRTQIVLEKPIIKKFCIKYRTELNMELKKFLHDFALKKYKEEKEFYNKQRGEKE